MTLAVTAALPSQQLPCTQYGMHHHDDQPPYLHPADHSLAALAMWFELRVQERVGWRDGSRLFGLEVLDAGALERNADTAARVTFLAEGDVYELLESDCAVLATRFDALGLCCFGTATNLRTGERFRSRTVLVATPFGQSTVNRLQGAPPEHMGAASGPVADRVAALFAETDRTERGWGA